MIKNILAAGAVPIPPQRNKPADASAMADSILRGARPSAPAAPSPAAQAQPQAAPMGPMTPKVFAQRVQKHMAAAAKIMAENPTPGPTDYAKLLTMLDQVKKGEITIPEAQEKMLQRVSLMIDRANVEVNRRVNRDPEKAEINARLVEELKQLGAAINPDSFALLYQGKDGKIEPKSQAPKIAEAPEPAPQPAQARPAREDRPPRYEREPREEREYRPLRQERRRYVRGKQEYRHRRRYNWEQPDENMSAFEQFSAGFAGPRAVEKLRMKQAERAAEGKKLGFLGKLSTVGSSWAKGMLVGTGHETSYRRHGKYKRTRYNEDAWMRRVEREQSLEDEGIPAGAIEQGQPTAGANIAQAPEPTPPAPPVQPTPSPLVSAMGLSKPQPGKAVEIQGFDKLLHEVTTIRMLVEGRIKYDNQKKQYLDQEKKTKKEMADPATRSGTTTPEKMLEKIERRKRESDARKERKLRAEGKIKEVTKAEAVAIAAAEDKNLLDDHAKITPADTQGITQSDLDKQSNSSSAAGGAAAGGLAAGSLGAAAAAEPAMGMGSTMGAGQGALTPGMRVINPVKGVSYGTVAPRPVAPVAQASASSGGVRQTIGKASVLFASLFGLGAGSAYAVEKLHSQPGPTEAKINQAAMGGMPNIQSSHAQGSILGAPAPTGAAIAQTVAVDPITQAAASHPVVITPPAPARKESTTISDAPRAVRLVENSFIRYQDKRMVRTL